MLQIINIIINKCKIWIWLILVALINILFSSLYWEVIVRVLILTIIFKIKHVTMINKQINRMVLIVKKIYINRKKVEMEILFLHYLELE